MPLKRKNDDDKKIKLLKKKRNTSHRNRIDPYIKGKRDFDLSEYIQDKIPVKNILNGIIETTSGDFLKIVEINPINFEWRSEDEQFKILQAFGQWTKISPVQIQYKIVTKKAEPEDYIKSLRYDMRNEDSPGVKELAEAHINMTKYLSSEHALTRRYFVVFKYIEDLENVRKNDKFLYIYQELMGMVQKLSTYLSRCENTLVVPENEDIFAAEIFYLILNRKTSLNEPYASRVARVYQDFMKAYERMPGIDSPPHIPVVNYIAPKGLDLSFPNYWIMDGLYYSVFCIKDYPGAVMGGWAGSLSNLGEGVDVDIFFNQEGSRDEEKMKLSKFSRASENKLAESSRHAGDFEEVKGAVQAGQYILSRLNGNERLLYMNILITITAQTYEELVTKKSATKDMLVSAGFGGYFYLFKQEEAFLSTLPLCKLNSSFYKSCKRNILASDAASAYMFTSFEERNDNGVLLGMNLLNNSLFIPDFFDTHTHNNANGVIFGSPGMGKTFTLLMLQMRFRMRQIPVYAIAPIKPHEFKRPCLNMGGEFIVLGSSTGKCINVLEIRPPNLNTDLIIDGEIAEQGNASLLGKKVQQIKTFFSLFNTGLTSDDFDTLDSAVMNTYVKKSGITLDNDSLYNKDRSLKEMPILEDLQNELFQNPNAQKLARSLNKFIRGSLSSFNGQTNIDPDNKYIVFDISSMGDDMQIGYFVALDFIYDRAKEDRTEKKAIFADELWLFTSGNEYVAKFTQELWKIIRGYSGGVIGSTQDVSDIFNSDDSKYAKAIISASDTHIILGLKPNEASVAQEHLNLTEEEKDTIMTFSRGECLVIYSKGKVKTTIVASSKEEELATTSRDKLLSIKNKNLKKMEQDLEGDNLPLIT